jgi:3-deoxy-D-manno-octulosonic-acid transferase
MWRYKLIILLLTPLIVIYTIFRAVKFKDKHYLLERLGLTNITKNHQKNLIWIHAASVGEVIAVIPLIQRIQNQYPKTPILITTNTTTGAEIVKKQLGSQSTVQHRYMPIDWNWTINKIIKKIQPHCVLIVETEIWPHFYNACFKNNIPIIIINARLSHRTTSAKPWLLNIYKKTLNKVTQVLARSKEDYDNYLKLGTPSSKLKLIGNIKLASINNNNLIPISLGYPYVLAASTHDDEEKQLTSIWMKLIKNKIVTNEILVIVPRHPDRVSDIIQQLKSLNANIVVRSNNDQITDLTDVYLADTVGELKQFMLEAKFIFVGGSLIPHGGQNIIEPAQLAKAIIFGQYMYNFKNESQLLLDNNAAIQVDNKDELYKQFVNLLQNRTKIKQLSEAALVVIKNQEYSILDQYMSELKKYIIH